MVQVSERDEKRIEDAITTLMEHFESVQIFATRSEGDSGTLSINKGRGNFYARIGQVREWIIREDAMTDHQARTDSVEASEAAAEEDEENICG